MLLEECVSRGFRILNTSIYEFFHLVHEDWILEDTRSLAFDGRDQFIKVHPQILTRIGKREKPRTIYPRLAVDVDGSFSVTQKRVKSLLKHGIPVQNIGVYAVDRIQHLVSLRKSVSPPRRRVLVKGAIDDMRNVVRVCKVGR